MGEYLELTSQTLGNKDLTALVNQELGDHPGLLKHLGVHDGTITTKLATCEHVFFNFEEMAALYWFVKLNSGDVQYGPRHEYNATPEEILKTVPSLYLGPPEKQESRKNIVLTIPVECAEKISHRKIWRKTKKTLSTNNIWYYRKIRPDETSGVYGNPNGYKTTCPNNDQEFRAIEAGSMWNWETNRARTLYRCRPCDMLFSMGEYETPQYEMLSQMLGISQGEDSER